MTASYNASIACERTNSPSTMTRVKRAWKLTCERAGIVNLHFHDLRREFASRMMEAGGTLHEVQAWLGHASIVMTARYLGVTDAGLRRSLDRFETVRPWAEDDAERTSGAQSDPAGPTLRQKLPSDLPANSLN